MKTLLATTALVLALAGCGKKEEQTITVKDDTGTAATISSDEGTTTIKSETGEVKIQQGGAAAFPDYAPQYPGSKVTTTMTATSDTQAGAGGMIAMETGDDPATVLAFYKDKLKAAGMPIRMETTTPEGGLIAAGQDENSKRGVMITVGKSDGKTNIAIISGKEK